MVVMEALQWGVPRSVILIILLLRWSPNLLQTEAPMRESPRLLELLPLLVLVLVLAGLLSSLVPMQAVLDFADIMAGKAEISHVFWQACGKQCGKKLSSCEG